MYSGQVGPYHAMLRHEVSPTSALSMSKVQVGQTRHLQHTLEIEVRLLVSMHLHIQFHGYLPLR